MNIGPRKKKRIICSCMKVLFAMHDDWAAIKNDQRAVRDAKRKLFNLMKDNKASYENLALRLEYNIRHNLKSPTLEELAK